MKKLMTIALMALLASCADKKETAREAEKTTPMSMHATSENTVAKKYTPDMVVNKKDYACGMPVTAGIEDTCHYKGKAYGFCSKECKEEFLKDPNKILAVMK